MRKINIAISQAKLESFTVEFEDNEAHLSATLALLTGGGKKISQYSINTRNYYQNKVEFPVVLLKSIFEIATEIEAIATRHCKDSQKALPAPKVEF